MMDRTHIARLPMEHQRLIEGWLPLAQAANERYGWGLGAQGLETLIVRAATRLGNAGSALAAQAILWSTYQHEHPDDSGKDDPIQ
jgi:hypothetical protein